MLRENLQRNLQRNLDNNLVKKMCWNLQKISSFLIHGWEMGCTCCCTCGCNDPCRCEAGFVKSSYDKKIKACKKLWASCGWRKVSRTKPCGTWGKKEPKNTRSPWWGKKETENTSGGVNSYLLLGIGGLAVSTLGVYYQREVTMATLWRTPAPEKEPESQPLEPKPKPKSSHEIYTTMSGNKLVKIAFNAAMLYGLWCFY